jgi:hypothetical protein
MPSFKLLHHAAAIGIPVDSELSQQEAATGILIDV